MVGCVRVFVCVCVSMNLLFALEPLVLDPGGRGPGVAAEPQGVAPGDGGGLRLDEHLEAWRRRNTRV